MSEGPYRHRVWPHRTSLPKALPGFCVSIGANGGGRAGRPAGFSRGSRGPGDPRPHRPRTLPPMGSPLLRGHILNFATPTPSFFATRVPPRRCPGAPGGDNPGPPGGTTRGDPPGGTRPCRSCPRLPRPRLLTLGRNGTALEGHHGPRGRRHPRTASRDGARRIKVGSTTRAMVSYRVNTNLHWHWKAARQQCSAAAIRLTKTRYALAKRGVRVGGGRSAGPEPPG